MATDRKAEFATQGPQEGMPLAVVFDLDGTLVDSVDDVSALLNEVLRETEVAAFSAKEAKGLMGEGAAPLIRKALRARGVAASEADAERFTARFLALYGSDPVNLTTTFPFALDVLSALTRQGIAIGVCTNKAHKPARLILERLSLGTHVQALIAGDSGFGQKPDPRPLLACASKLEVPPSDLVYVGDHQIDVDTARAAHVAVVAVAYGYSDTPAAGFGADRVITSLSELPAALHGLTSEPARSVPES